VTQKKRELLKCVVAAMYIWQHCGAGTLSYRQPRYYFSNHESVERSTVCFRHKNVFYKINDSLEGFSKVPVFFVSPCISDENLAAFNFGFIDMPLRF